MEESTDSVEFEFTLPTPDQLESEARELPTLDSPLSPAADWPVRWSGLGISLRLPEGFQKIESENPDQITWHHPDSSAISVHVHEGGDHCVAFAEAEGVEVGWLDEGTFQIPFAGRTGKVNLARVSASTTEFFYASAQVGIKAGFGILLLVAAPTRDRRTILMNVIPTVVSADL